MPHKPFYFLLYFYKESLTIRGKQKTNYHSYFILGNAKVLLKNVNRVHHSQKYTKPPPSGEPFSKNVII